MKLSEIITGPGRDEHISGKSIHFQNSPTLTVLPGDISLKKVIVYGDLWYGLLDQITAELIGILQLEQYDSTKWQVRLVQVDPRYKGQGYGTALYDYAVMNDNLTILSDTNNSEGGEGGSKGLWGRLYRQGRYRVCGYDLDTDTEITNARPDVIYNQKENIVWMATPWPKQEKMFEMLKRFNDTHRRRTFVWYGPEVTDWF